jgi:hypothetical protein
MAGEAPALPITSRHLRMDYRASPLWVLRISFAKLCFAQHSKGSSEKSQGL